MMWSRRHTVWFWFSEYLNERICTIRYKVNNYYPHKLCKYILPTGRLHIKSETAFKIFFISRDSQSIYMTLILGKHDTISSETALDMAFPLALVALSWGSDSFPKMSSVDELDARFTEILTSWESEVVALEGRLESGGQFSCNLKLYLSWKYKFYTTKMIFGVTQLVALQI